MDYTQKEHEALVAAQEKGCPFPQNYQLPYTVEEINDDVRKKYNWNNHFYFRWDHSKTLWKKFPKVFYRVLFADQVQSGYFFKTFEGARTYAESMNVRHFKIASTSKNPKIPVLI
jgi:hypothetical protein